MLILDLNSSLTLDWLNHFLKKLLDSSSECFMENEPALSPFEYSGFNESKLDKQIDRIKNQNTQGSILFSSKTFKKTRAFRWIRIRSFFTKHKKFKRLVEFSIHPTGIHMLRLAVFYSESGCGMCRVYVEKNLF